MFCRHCHTEIEEGFQFCPKCGLRLKTVAESFRGSAGKRATRWVAAVAVTFFGVGLVAFAVRQNRLSNLKQGARDGLAYTLWLAGEAPSESTLEVVIGKPFRSIKVSNGRSITWFRIRDGFLGLESTGGIFHFRPDKALSHDVLSSYQKKSEPVFVAGEMLTTYDCPNDLGLTAVASGNRASALSEIVVWRQSAN